MQGLRMHLNIALLWFLSFGPQGWSQENGNLQGKVTLKGSGEPLHGVTVLIVQLGRAARTEDDGKYEIRDVPPGSYKVLAHLNSTLTDEARTVEVSAGGSATADFQLSLSVLRQEITVTASGREEPAFDSFQAVTSLNALDLTWKSAPSLGELLENQPGTGIAKRSFGPGSSRPVIRGFDGDRVLVLQDGIRTGTLSSQSGDHGELIDSANLDRLEVVRGPATLLYGSNALGGVVNTITRHHESHEHPHQGLRGYLTGVGGSNNAYGGGAAGFEYGRGNWLLWGDGGGQRTGDYHAPLGDVSNSRTRVRNGSGGFGRYGNRAFLSFSYGFSDGRYGIPFASEAQAHGEEAQEPEKAKEEEEFIDIDARRHNLRFTGGIQDLGSVISSFRLQLNYIDYEHAELERHGEEPPEVGTVLDNREFVYRGMFEQRKRGPHSGRFGFWGLLRDYKATGAEALAPPVDQTGFAAFTLQELDFDRVKLQFGGRVEHNSYDPLGLQSRSFTGFSGSAGIHVPLWRGGAFISNYTRSYRAPALEELYNNGPHPGNVAFEVGNPNLKPEQGNGVDLSLRHQASRVRAEANLFYYSFRDFIFPAPTGAIEDGLREVEFEQGDSRYLGLEAGLGLGLHPNLWLNLGLDAVDAELTESGSPLPRIPPLRGRFGFEGRYKGFSVQPELILARSQRQIFATETPTAGYAVLNLGASYTIARQHVIHAFGVNVFNVGDRLYRNHLSLIKNLAPEIGRGVRFSYTVRFF